MLATKFHQKRGRVIGRPTRRLRLNPVKPKFGKGKRLIERLDHAHRIVLVDPVVEAFGKKRQLTSIRTLDKAYTTGRPTLRVQQSALFGLSAT